MKGNTKKNEKLKIVKRLLKEIGSMQYLRNNMSLSESNCTNLWQLTLDQVSEKGSFTLGQMHPGPGYVSEKCLNTSASITRQQKQTGGGRGHTQELKQELGYRTPRQMKAQANTTREQSNNNSIYDVGWQPSHGENGGVGKKNTYN